VRRLLHRRRRGSGRGATALAVRQAEAGALIGGAVKLDATGVREGAAVSEPAVIPARWRRMKLG
jgi:hypothetical protein